MKLKAVLDKEQADKGEIEHIIKMAFNQLGRDTIEAKSEFEHTGCKSHVIQESKSKN